MHRALPSFAWVFLMLPGCGDAPSADEPLGGGHGGSGGAVEPSASGDADGTGGSDGPSSGGSASDASSGGDEEGAESGGMTGGQEIGGVCGDGVRDAGELCDDGNVRSGDGCDSDCTVTIGVAAFSTGGAHTCALSFEGTVRCFGDNTHGQLGIAGKETIGDDETPLEAGRLVKLPRITQISAGSSHTCAVSTDYEVYCWGANASGQLGVAHTEDWGDEARETPTAIDLDGPVASVSAGASHTCARFFGGTVRCWGSGASGQLGHGDGFAGTVGAGVGPYPRVMDAPDVDLGRTTIIRELSAGYDHSCGVDSLGAVYCWGQGGQGRLGTGDEATVGISESPLDFGLVTVDEPSRSVFASTRHTCSVTTGWGLQCFGTNGDGQLGLGHTATIGDDEAVESLGVDLGRERVVSAALTDTSTCALTTHGTVFCWGAGEKGQLGYGTTDTVGDDEPPTAWDGFGPVKLTTATTAIDAGTEHVCARTDDARLRCWGRAEDGRLGQGVDDIEFYGDDTDEREPLVVRIFR